MDGVDINDNVLGQPNALFIEDAIQEVQVLTSGVSAEYGRFSGGVVNVITKSGGNLFSGAFRTQLHQPGLGRRDAAREERRHHPRQQAVADLRDDRRRPGGARPRLVLRRRRASSARPRRARSAQTRVPYTSRNDNTRYEGQADRDGRQRATRCRAPSSTTRSRAGAAVVRRQHRPGHHDHAVDAEPALRDDLARRGRRRGRSRPRSTRRRTGSWQNAGNSSTNVLRLADSDPRLHGGRPRRPPVQRAVLGFHRPGRAQQPPARPPACRRCCSSRRAGTHEVKGGFEYFVSTRVGGNSQTSTGYVFQTDYVLDADGRPALDADGGLIPRFVPGVVARAGVAADARRHDRHHDRVALRERPLGGDAAADLRPRPALRNGRQRGDRRHQAVDVQTLVPRARRRLRPDRRRPDHPAGHLRPLRRQVQRRAVLAQLQRRQRGPLRHGLHRAGGRRPRLRRRPSTRRTTPSPSAARSRPPTSSLPATCSRR